MWFTGETFWITKGTSRQSLTPMKGERRKGGLGRKSLRQQYSLRKVLSRLMGSPWANVIHEGSGQTYSFIGWEQPGGSVASAGTQGWIPWGSSCSSQSTLLPIGRDVSDAVPVLHLLEVFRFFLLMFDGHKDHKCFHATKLYLCIWRLSWNMLLLTEVKDSITLIQHFGCYIFYIHFWSI